MAYPFTLLDITDVSIFDFPAWIAVYSSNTTAPTNTHARGRLPDVGVATNVKSVSAGNQSRSTPVGTTIRDQLGNVAYVTMNALILPYNALVI
jgi:hypothetical protein